MPIPTSAEKILSISDLERAASDKLQVSARGIDLSLDLSLDLP